MGFLQNFFILNKKLLSLLTLLGQYKQKIVSIQKKQVENLLFSCYGMTI